MKIEFKNLEKVIEKFFIKILDLDVVVKYNNNFFVISIIKYEIDVIILVKENLYFYLGKNFDKVKFSFIYENVNKFLYYLNKNIELPISFRLGKNNERLDLKSVFILGTDGDLGNVSDNNIELINLTKKIYTNNIKEVEKSLFSLNILDKELYDFKDIYNLDLEKEIEIILLYYGDIFNGDFGLSKINHFLNSKGYKIYIQPFYSDFINKYSLSHNNYGCLNYLGVIRNLSDLDLLKSDIEKFVYRNSSIKLNFDKGDKIYNSCLSIEFLDLKVLKLFFDKIREIFNETYLFEIIFETKDGYHNYIDLISDYSIDYLTEEENTSLISIFIYPKICGNFLGHKKFHSYSSSRKLIYLSSSLSNRKEFTKKTINLLKKSKYIFGESKKGAEKCFNDLNISLVDKNIFEGDDIEMVKKYIEKYGFFEGDEFIYVKNVFQDLVKLLEKSQDIYILSDGGTPCILDPGNNIKKYVDFNYKEYSIFGIKGPSVLPTVLLGCMFQYKNIFWTPFLYSISSKLSHFIKNSFFSKSDFGDTLIIFYSFGNYIKEDLEKIKKIFEKDIKIQIMGDIGTEREYNKLFSNLNISNKEILHISKNLNNTVYLLKY